MTSYGNGKTGEGRGGERESESIVDFVIGFDWRPANRCSSVTPAVISQEE